jgi:large subunit ribosomal protein L31
MKPQVSVKYNSKTNVKCLNCGSTYTIGLTLDSLNLEICANCHPYYTGQDTVIDATGRIEKFKARLEKVTNNNEKKDKTKTRKLKSPSSAVTFQLQEESIEENESKIEADEKLTSKE